MIPAKSMPPTKPPSNTRAAPTVILAKTVKGYGLGEAGEGRNISHQQKKMNEKELREFRARFDVPIRDEDVVETPFYRPAKDSRKPSICWNAGRSWAGFMPKRVVKAEPLRRRGWRRSRFHQRLGRRSSTTMSFVRLLSSCCGHKRWAARWCPSFPMRRGRSASTALFSQVGIYSSKGQLYEPVDKKGLQLLSRSQGRPDSGGRHHRGRFDGVVRGGGHGLRQLRRQPDSVLHLLLDVRPATRGRRNLAGGGQPGQGLFAGRDFRAAPRSTAKACNIRTATAR
jgi:hypothetical protein